MLRFSFMPSLPCLQKEIHFVPGSWDPLEHESAWKKSLPSVFPVFLNVFRVFFWFHFQYQKLAHLEKRLLRYQSSGNPPKTKLGCSKWRVGQSQSMIPIGKPQRRPVPCATPLGWEPKDKQPWYWAGHLVGTSLSWVLGFPFPIFNKGRESIWYKRWQLKSHFPQPSLRVHDPSKEIGSSSSGPCLLLLAQF